MTDLIAADVSQTKPDSTALTDLRQLAMAVPTATMQAALTEYVEKRKTLRDWLLAQMEEGVHFGVPPGCEPKGNVNPKQWKAKPSLYKAGAELVIDLMGLRQTYEADLIGWQQLGSEKGTCVYKCRLISRSTGEEVGQGIGAGKLGRKMADENKAVKDAQKRAMVASVLNAYGLSDLFTQDVEDHVPEANENPAMRPGAPLAPSRAQRKAQPKPEPHPNVAFVSQIMLEWKRMTLEANESTDGTRFWTWFRKVTGSVDNPARPDDWSESELSACRKALGLEVAE